MIKVTKRLSKSGIEYLDCQWGIFSGCHNLERHICSIQTCLARKLVRRFASHYPNGFEPTFYPEALESPLYIKKPSVIGVAWVGDIIGYGLKYKEEVYSTIERCPWHTFLFLTKNSENLAKWNLFAKNCFVGVTATNYQTFVTACGELGALKHTGKINLAFLSLEPLLDWDTDSSFVLDWLMHGEINWVIIGAMTGTLEDIKKGIKKAPIWNIKDLKPMPLNRNRWSLQPPISWVSEIVAAADKAGCAVFLKDNLRLIILSV